MLIASRSSAGWFLLAPVGWFPAGAFYLVKHSLKYAALDILVSVLAVDRYRPTCCEQDRAPAARAFIIQNRGNGCNVIDIDKLLLSYKGLAVLDKLINPYFYKAFQVAPPFRSSGS